MDNLNKRILVLFLTVAISKCSAYEQSYSEDTSEITRLLSETRSEYSENQFTYEIDEMTKTAVLVKVQNYNSEKITIPDEVKGCKIIKVADKAFGDPVSKKWKQIILPDSIIKIGERTFNFCTNLESIKLPCKLEKIGSECFFCCSNLQKINIPDSVNFIGESAFYSCISLKKINIPKSLKILENKLFEHCISLNGIYIHENIEKISNNIFEKCSVNLNLSKTKINKNNKFYEIKNNCIVNKKDDSKVVKFSVNDDTYKNKIKIAKLLYQKMQDFLKMHENYSFKNFEEAFQNFFSTSTGLPKTISNDEFEKQSRNKVLLFRGVRSQKFADNFKSGKIFFATNLENERGSGIYTTSNLLHAQFWTFPTDTDWVSADYGDIDLENLSWADAINLVYERNLFSHGEVVKMFLNDNAKILENTYLLELKDIIYKMYHEKFKNIAAFIDVTWPSQAVKDLEVYRTKEELLFHNSGLLTKLLGYDVLYEKEYKLEISVDKNEDRREFLIVNPGVLVISG